MQNKIHIMKSVLYGAHIIGDIMFKGSNFILLGKIQISFVLIWYTASASWEVWSMLSWYRLQWNWWWRFAQCSADLASNGTDAGGSTKQMLSIHQHISNFMYRTSAVSDNEHKTWQVLLQIEIKKNVQVNDMI